MGHAELLSLGLHPATPLRSPGPSAALPSLPERGAASSAQTSSPEGNLSSPRAEKPSREGSVEVGQAKGRPSSCPCQGSGGGSSGTRTRIPLTALPAPPGDAPGSGSPKQAPSSLSASETHADSRARGDLCRSRQGLPRALRPAPRAGPPPGPLGAVRHAPPGPSASSALAPRAPVSRILTRTQLPPAAGPSRDSPALGQ